eukprot:TRINITY_DN14820_c0_g2_i1.p1 TRINITY_DN14820_c0_g2~~TRINITY_DN14820_c0_g2_i1.p1  ORF type:complete len:194 (-),score=19.72 TRINITY_DN14820_c0_g2_i1:364-945(-)
MRKRDPWNSTDDMGITGRSEQEPIVYLDTDEQEQLVESFEEANKRTSQTWRRCFSVVSFCLCCVFLFLALEQVRHPWGVRLHAEFRGLLTSSAIIVADITTATAFLLLLFVLQSSTELRRRLLQLTAAIAGSLFLFWTYQISRFPRPHPWNILWLPFAVPIYAGIIAHVESTLSSTNKDISKLRSSMYDYKTL